MLRVENPVQHVNTMQGICRLCCSSNFVRNDIFEPGDSLHAKIALYMPLQVQRGDRLPQRVCDVCRGRVLLLHEFCCQALRAQHRLQTVLLAPGESLSEAVDLLSVKRCPSPIPRWDRATQTEPELPAPLPAPLLPDFLVSVKQEPVDHATPKLEQDGNPPPPPSPSPPPDEPNVHSDDSDNVSLISLKKKKRKKKHKKEKSEATNGDFKGKKRKKNMKEWKMIMSALPEGTTIGVVGSADQTVDLKQESDSDGLDEPVSAQQTAAGGGSEQYTCCVCLGKFYSHATMLEHYMSHRESCDAESPPPPAEPREPRCPRCGKGLPPGSWPDHWRRHWLRDRRPYRCTLCELSFRKPQQILKHGQVHARGDDAASQPGKRYVCDHCSEEFVYMRYLLAHRSRAHPAAAGTALALRCALCSRQFRHLNSLRRHQRAHAGERTHLCNMCGKALSSREHLKFHIRIHTGYKPNVCNTCGKGFAKKCNLTLHERTHSGEKPHQCSVCHKAFSQRSTLVIHERYHSGARPYVCSLCGRGFVAKGLLSMHLKTTCV